MKRLISVVLVALMVLGMANVGFAKNTSGAWSGSYKVAEYEGRNNAVNVKGEATLDPAMSFSGVVMLTADVYAKEGGTVSFEDGSGNKTGEIVLANSKINGSEVSYDTSKWNTFKIFAMTGVKKYQIYLGDVFVCEAETLKNVVPSIVKFNSADMYLDNISISQMKKDEPYSSSAITYSYESNFTEASVGTRAWGLEEWMEAPESGTGVTYLISDDVGIGKAIKMENMPNTEQTGSSRNMMYHSTGSGKENHIFDLDLYIPDKVKKDGEQIANKATINIYGRGGDNRANSLISIYPDYIRYDGYYGQNYTVPKNRWFNIKIEALYEQQGINIYVDNVKINPYVIPLLNNGIYGSMPEIARFDIYLRDNSEVPTVAYLKSVKLGQIKDEITQKVFTENFDSDTAKFTYTQGRTVYADDSFNTLSLTSNATTAAGETGKGKLYSTRNKDGNRTRVTEDCPIVIPSGDSINNYLDSEADSTTIYMKEDARFYSDAFDLQNADKVTVEFKFYNAAMSRHSSDFYAVDEMRVNLHKDIYDSSSDISAIARPYLRFNRFQNVYMYDKGKNFEPDLVYHSEGTNGVRKWYDAKLTITPGTSKPFSITVNGRTQEFGDTAVSTYELSQYKYLSFNMDPEVGGCFYLDDIAVTKSFKADKDHVKKLYSTDTVKTFTNMVSESASEASVEVTFTDGKYTSGMPKTGYKVGKVNVINKAIADGNKIVAAVYDDNKVTGVAILDRTENGVYDFSSKNMAVTDSSKVKVFNFENMSTIKPIGLPAAIDKDTKRAKLYVIGDSTAAYYQDSVKETDIYGFGSFLTDYVDSNKLEVINCGKSGRSAKSMFEKKNGDTAYDDLFGENGAVATGDYVLICLGINDSQYGDSDNYSNPYDMDEAFGGAGVSYAAYMKKIINAVKAKGANPILVAEAPGLNFADIDSDGNNDTFAYNELFKWCSATYRLGAELNIPVVDAYGMAIDYMNKVGYTVAKSEFAALADGSVDENHYNLFGARKRAELICKGLKLSDSGIADYIK